MEAGNKNSHKAIRKLARDFGIFFPFFEPLSFLVYGLILRDNQSYSNQS